MLSNHILKQHETFSNYLSVHEWLKDMKCWSIWISISSILISGLRYPEFVILEPISEKFNICSIFLSPLIYSWIIAKCCLYVMWIVNERIFSIFCRFLPKKTIECWHNFCCDTLYFRVSWLTGSCFVINNIDLWIDWTY